MGTAYTQIGRIYVGMKSEMQDSSDALGTLAHELCHFALQLTYDNGCKPFDDDDKVTEAIFVEIATGFKMNRFDVFRQDAIVARALNSGSPELEELIVRVPHLCARYMNKPVRLQNLKTTFYKFLTSTTNTHCLKCKTNIR